MIVIIDLRILLGKIYKFKSIFNKKYFKKFLQDESGNLNIHLKKRDIRKYTPYKFQEAEKICDEYVLTQNIFESDFFKNIIDVWSSGYYKKLNQYLRGNLEVSYMSKCEFESFRIMLSNIIKDNHGLIEDTLLFRGEKDVDLSRFVIGRNNYFKGFISTSFSIETAKIFSGSLISNNNYIIKIYAKVGTKGIAINGKELGVFRNQNEWLLNENQMYVTKNIDKINKIIEIELI